MNIEECRMLNELLLDTFNIVEKVEGAALQAAGGEDLSVCEYHMLSCIADGGGAGRTIGEIAQTLDVTTPTVTVMVNKLVRKGYLEKRRGERDGRVVDCFPTALGLRMSQLHRYFHRKMAISVGSEFTDEELKILIRCIEKLNAFLKSNAELSSEQHREEDESGV